MKTVYYKKESFLLLWLAAIFTFSSCVKEGSSDEDCDDTICFVFDYNLEFIDLFHKQVSKLHLFIFNEDERLITVIEDQVDGTFPEGYQMKTTLEEGTYTFVAWAGLYEESYIYETMTRSESPSIKDFYVAVNTGSLPNAKSDETGSDLNTVINKKLHNLWHGEAKVNYQKGKTITIPLIKNTKTIRIVMKNMDDDGTELNVNDFDFVIHSPNGVYAYNNEPLETTYHYHPYFKDDNTEAGAVAEINTLRLKADISTKLDIIHKQTGKSILGKEVELNTFLNVLRLQEYQILPFQEYLDRANRFSVIFLYKGFDVENMAFTSFQIKINNWVVHEQDYNKYPTLNFTNFKQSR